jgi:hypothetical protein
LLRGGSDRKTPRQGEGAGEACRAVLSVAKDLYGGLLRHRRALFDDGIGADEKAIAGTDRRGMTTSTIHVLVLVLVFFAMPAERRA